MLTQSPAGGSQAAPNDRRDLTVGRTTPRATDTTTTTTHDPVSARRLRVALLAGGRSSEHEISLASARSVLEALDPERYDVVERRDRPRRPLGARAGRRRQAP